MIKEKIKEWKKYSEISGVSTITRRYFVMNAFDGALTMLGVILGAYLAGLPNPSVIISAAIGGSIAMGASGMSGAYMTEKAERTKKIKDLEKALLTDLKDGLHGKSHRFATVFAALVDGISPAIAAIFVISPFFLVPFDIISSEIAFFTSIFLTLFVLLILGMYLAKISDESMIRYGLQMLLVGIITTLIIYGTLLLFPESGQL